MKKCPICGAATVDEAATCFECLYSFERMSCVASVGQSDAQDAAEASPLVESGESVSPVQSAPCLDPAAFEIVATEPTSATRTYSLERGSLYVGRLPTNDIVLSEPTVSRRHLHVFVEGDAMYVEDMGSTNTAYLNGNPIKGRHVLAPGDSLTIRNASLLLRERQ